MMLTMAIILIIMSGGNDNSSLCKIGLGIGRAFLEGKKPADLVFQMAMMMITIMTILMMFLMMMMMFTVMTIMKSK